MALTLFDADPAGCVSEQELRELSAIVSHMHDLLGHDKTTYIHEIRQVVTVPHTWLVMFDNSITRRVCVTIDPGAPGNPSTLEWS